MIGLHIFKIDNWVPTINEGVCPVNILLILLAVGFYSFLINILGTLRVCRLRGSVSVPLVVSVSFF